MTCARITAARYEPSTKTIRSVPENYWLATMDSWDGAVDHDAMARVFAAAPEMLEALREVTARLRLFDPDCATLQRANHAIAKAEGKP